MKKIIILIVIVVLGFIGVNFIFNKPPDPVFHNMAYFYLSSLNKSENRLQKDGYFRDFSDSYAYNATARKNVHPIFNLLVEYKVELQYFEDFLERYAKAEKLSPEIAPENRKVYDEVILLHNLFQNNLRDVTLKKKHQLTAMIEKQQKSIEKLVEDYFPMDKRHTYKGETPLSNFSYQKTLSSLSKKYKEMK